MIIFYLNKNKFNDLYAFLILPLLHLEYHYLEDHYQPIPEPFDYFDPSYGGRSSAEYCPVFTENTAIDGKMYYLGHCSYGSSNYGKYLSTSNGDLQIYTKEKYSDNSFCVLSTLIHSSINAAKNSRSKINFLSRI